MEPGEIRKIADLIIKENNINVYSTELIETIKDSRFFYVKTPFKNLNVYIVDTVEGAHIATKPEIVGGKFLNLNLNAALAAVAAMKKIVGIDQPIVFLHILRGSIGYMLHEAFSRVGIPYYNAFVRVKYVIESYRDHTQRKIKIPYRKFEKIPEGDIILVIADTIATGLSVEAAIKATYEKFSEQASHIRKLVLYGFISNEGIKKIYGLVKKLGIKQLYVFAMQDITALAYNKYDMPLYGPDESLWNEKNELKTLGSIADLNTLERMLPEYAPGMDQPGDWSERQNLLFNGHSYEKGDIVGHLRKSLALLEKLRKIVRKTSWYGEWIDKIFKKRKVKLLKTLQHVTAKI